MFQALDEHGDVTVCKTPPSVCEGTVSDHARLANKCDPTGEDQQVAWLCVEPPPPQKKTPYKSTGMAVTRNEHPSAWRRS